MPESDSLEKKEIQLDRILLAAREQGASDVHFKVGYKPTIRLYGELEEIKTREVDGEDLTKITKAILNEKKQLILFENKNVDASLEVRCIDKKTNEKKIYRHRVNVAYDENGPYTAIRLIPDKIMDVREIGFPFEIWKNIVNLKRGLVLVTGITGSGKTTTLASLIQEINRTRRDHIITLEDPIEYVYPKGNSMISQRELGTNLKSFADGVKYSLRQDPDVILVGEIRDRETAYHALEACATGHLVLSTLHTINAADTVRRYVNLFDIEDHNNIRTSLASNLAYVLSQQLIPYGREGLEKGRTLAMEVMNVKDSPAIKKHLREGEYHQIPGQMQIERKQKSILMDERIKELYKSGEIEKEVAISHAYDQEKMKQEFDKLIM